MSRLDINEILRPPRHRPLRRLPSIVVRSVRLVWRAAPRQFFWSALLQGSAGLAAAAQLFAGGEVLSHVLNGTMRIDDAMPALLVLVVVTALVTFANMARVEQQRLLTELVGMYAIDKVLEVATRVPLIAFETPGFHDRLERAKINAISRPVSVATGVLGVFSAGCAVLGIGSALLTIDPWFTALVLVAYVPAAVAAARASRASHDFAVAQTERDRRRAYLMLALTGKSEAQEVRAFALGRFLRDRHDELYQHKVTDLRRLVRHRLRLSLTGAVATSVMTGGALAVLLWSVAVGRLSVAAAGTAAGGVVLLGTRLQAMASAAAALFEGSLFIEDFTSFVDMMPKLGDAAPSGAAVRFSDVAVRDVTFTYPSRQQPSLRDVSLDIRPGEIVALVGENGSGKTTLAKLLAGLYRPDRGTISWGGVDTAACDPRQVHDAVAVIFQDYVHYQLTVRENIAMGRHERYDDLEQTYAAARSAQIHDQLVALDEGYDTRLGPQFLGGSDLSLGQWQRVALARAFFRNAPFVILDEPTASLDPRAEAELFADIRSLCQARSVLLISHRFASVRSADRIYVLHEGRVVEHGSHDELMTQDGRYAHLFSLQAARYLPGLEKTVGGAR